MIGRGPTIQINWKRSETKIKPCNTMGNQCQSSLPGEKYRNKLIFNNFYEKKIEKMY